MKKRFGFTLAEVLITLGIIGVVAAMTIPTLIANTNGAKFRSQFKKTVSTLNQAGLMAQAQYDFDYGSAQQACGDDNDATGKLDNPQDRYSFCAILNGTLSGQTLYNALTDIKIQTNTGGSIGSKDYAVNDITGANQRGLIGSGEWASTSGFKAYQLADGSIVAFADADRPGGTGAKACALDLGAVMGKTWIEDHPKCVGFIDVNGATLPNREVKCSNGGGRKANYLDQETDCMVKNDAASMTDVFPIVFHDASVEPASNAAKYVLTTAK